MTWPSPQEHEVAEQVSLMQGALADRYRIEREIGRGGTAIVYRAHDLKHNRLVALKVLRPEVAAALGPERFLREIEIAARLNHPHILPLHDSGQADRHLYYVMPFVEGESLRNRLQRQQQLPLEEALQITREVSSALSYAHAHDVVHRDIKPENILLSGGVALVADFGIAQAVRSASADQLTSTGVSVGTPAYMSPEQAAGQAPLDGRADQYSLACVLYEMLAGVPPFTGPNQQAVLARHAIDPVPPLRTVRSAIPQPVEQAVLRALAKSPADRFPTLEAFLQGLTQPGASRARRRVAFALVGTLAVLAAGYALSIRRGTTSGRGRHVVVAVLPIQSIGGDSTLDGVADELTDQLITDLAQVHALKVINTQTMMRYRDSTPQQVVRARGADAVIVSRMRPRGDSVHVTAQLVLAASDQAVWAGSFDGRRREVLQVQRDIARAVTEQVSAHTSAQERAALGDRGRVVAPDAFDLYARGRFWWNRRNRENLLKAIDAYNQALEIEPLFAPAYAGMADAYAQLGYGGFLRPDDAFPKAEAAARTALALDSTLAGPHATLGYAAMYYDWSWSTADHEYRAAIAHNPSYATAHEWYGLFLAAMGRFDEAQDQERLALELDPLSIAIAGTAGWVLHYSGKQAQAEAVLRSALRTDSSFAIGQLYMGRVLQFEGHLDSALAHFARTGAFRSWIPTVAGEAYVYAQQGRRAEAVQILRRLDSLSSSGEYVTSYAMALVEAALGDRDKAFAALDRAVQERTHWLLWLNRDRRWDPIRSDPRFATLVRRVDLPE
jgi:eukaryotic-like serine/threonine-protein kinase